MLRARMTSQSALCTCVFIVSCGGKGSVPVSGLHVRDAEAPADVRDAASGDGNDDASCSSVLPLLGASYDITESLFAFGTAPSKEATSGLIRWVGSDGSVAIWSDGSEGGSLNASAPEN